MMGQVSVNFHDRLLFTRYSTYSMLRTFLGRGEPNPIGVTREGGFFVIFLFTSLPFLGLSY